MDLTRIDRVVDDHGADPASLVMILQDVQEACNYLPDQALRHVAQRLVVPLSRVYHVATFYSSFSLTPRGRHVIRVCDGTACHLRGGTYLQHELTRQLGIGPGETTPDGIFSLELVACLGACALAPVLTVGRDYYGQMTAEKVEQTLEDYRNRPADQAAG